MKSMRMIAVVLLVCLLPGLAFAEEHIDAAAYFERLKLLIPSLKTIATGEDTIVLSFDAGDGDNLSEAELSQFTLFPNYKGYRHYILICMKDNVPYYAIFMKADPESEATATKETAAEDMVEGMLMSIGFWVDAFTPKKD